MRKYSIKENKPSKKSKFKQGYYRPSKKYAGSVPIIYRSSYEYKYMVYLDRNPNVVRWGSESFGIPYIGSDNKKHQYFIDFTYETQNGDIFLVEVKPYNQTLRNSYDYPRNKRKWKAAIEYANRECERGKKTKFIIITEKFLNKCYK